LSSINNDINSTEKLLNVIRGKDQDPFRSLGKQKASLSGKNPAKKINTIFPKHFFDKKIYTVGVDIGREFICLVKTTKGSDGRPVLVDQKVIKYNQQASDGSSGFNSFLKSSLVAFCGSVDSCNIWTKISSSDVNVFFVKVPRVPAKQLDNVIYWAAKKEGFIDETKSIFDFELQGEVLDQDKPKYSVMVYTAMKTSIEEMKTLFSDIGINLTGITTVPFAVQNIFRSKWMSTSEEIFASLFIGNNFSRIDVYKKENLVMSRGIKTGSINSMVEAIAGSVWAKTGNVKLKNDEAKKILLSLGTDSDKLRDTYTDYDLKKEKILEMISPVWERLARQVDLTLKTSAIGYEKVEKIYILSSVNVDKSILDYMSDQLGTKTEFFDPFEKLTASPTTQSISLSDRLFLSPALGFSLSDNSRTPNAIFTYHDKNREKNARLINRVVFSAFAAALIICLATIIYQFMERNTLNKQKIKLETELSLYNPLLTKDKVSKVAEEIKNKRKMDSQYAQRYLGIAAIGEVSDITPENIRLISFKISEESASPKVTADKTTKEAGDGVIIEGVIFGDRSMLDSLLAQYVMKLENSPMLRKVSIQKNSIVTFKKGEVLQFTLSAKIG
jgi:Tfp pilus assembly PilM family ATPase